MEIIRHGVSIVGNYNSSHVGCNAEDVGIGHSDDAPVQGTQKIEKRFPASQANHNLVVEIGVRLKARPHALGVWIVRRAPASFA